MMHEQDVVNYERVAKAIEYIDTHFDQQPSLDEIAKVVHISAKHFQKMFTEWVGTSPKKFLQYISVEHAKVLLKVGKTSVFDITDQVGLSSSSRLHDLFVKIEGMTPAEYRNGGVDLTIYYSISDSPFGKIIVASTHKGICYMAFFESQELAISEMKLQFPSASFVQQKETIHRNATAIFHQDWSNIEPIKLHLKGTAFQLKVWHCLLTLPLGTLSTYGDISVRIGNSKASRAVGSAIGHNPVSFLIPCHRVIRSSGIIGGYRWGNTRKKAIIGWEQARMEHVI